MVDMVNGLMNGKYHVQGGHPIPHGTPCCSSSSAQRGVGIGVGIGTNPLSQT